LEEEKEFDNNELGDLELSNGDVNADNYMMKP
jgi:hypothetical protein